MISAAMALITGLLGKIGFGWALSLFSGGFMGVISKMFSAIVDRKSVV